LDAAAGLPTGAGERWIPSQKRAMRGGGPMVIKRVRRDDDAFGFG
jgi:hypothetical protein